MGWLISVWCMFGQIGRARAQPAVLLFEAGERPGLCAALRIAFAGAGEVECVPEPPAANATAQLAVASAAVRSQHARLGLLIEGDGEGKVVRMVMVGPRPDRAVLAVANLSDAPGPDVDRSLALKAREAHDIMAEAADPERALAAFLAPQTPPSEAPAATPSPPPAKPPDAAPRDERFHLLLGAEAGLVFGKRLLPAGQLAVGVEREQVAWLTDLVIAVSGVGRDPADPDLDLTVNEWQAGLWARALLRRSRFALGASLGLAGARLVSRYRNASGERAQRTLYGLRPALEANLRVPFADAWALTLSPRLELLVPRDELTVSGRVVNDRGSLRGAVFLGLVWRWP